MATNDTNSLTEQRDPNLAGLRAVLLAVACGLLAGCFDTKQEITLNLDGTGKMVIESICAQTPALFQGRAQNSGQPGITNFIRKLIEDAEGVEAWQDVSFHQREDGSAWFRGTAYFSDLSKLKLGTLAFHRYSTTRDAAGNFTLAIAASTPVGAPFQQSNGPVSMEAIQRERATVRSAMLLLQATIGAMKQDTTFHVPGTIQRASNFESLPPNTLRLRFDGAKFTRAVEDILFDPSLDEARLSGKKTTFDDLLNEKLYGQKAPVLAVIKPGNSPLFDYAAEVAEARRSFTEISRTLGLADDTPMPTKPAMDGEPATVRVAGVQWQFESEPTYGFGLGSAKRGYIVNLRAELPGSIFGVNKVQFDKATTMEGMNLLPQKPGWDQSPNPRLLPGGTNVAFRACLASPPLDAAGIAELSGFLECSRAENQRTVELVAGKLRAGTTGTEFDTRIDDVRLCVTGGEIITLRTRLDAQQLRSLKIIGDAGQNAALERHGQTTFGREHLYTYRSRHDLPRTGKIVAEVLTGNQTVRIPFALKNVTLLGQPRPQ